MRYADPSANRDLLGNRTLLFIFICAFALVTLLQQILYSKSYIKRGFQFGWQRGDQQANWTGLFNDSDSPTEQNITGSSSRSCCTRELTAAMVVVQGNLDKVKPANIPACKGKGSS